MKVLLAIRTQYATISVVTTLDQVFIRLNRFKLDGYEIIDYSVAKLAA